MEQYQKYIHDVYTNNEDAIYRLKLFFIDNCYECLANECSQKTPDKNVIARILNDIKNKNFLSDIKLEEQSKKGRIILHVMKKNSPTEFIFFYKTFKIAKNIKFKLQKRKHVE